MNTPGLMTVVTGLGPKSTNTPTYSLHINGKPAFVASIFSDNSGENAHRMAACWNALSDLSQDALDGGWTRAGLEAYGNRMKAQRDELLEALQNLLAVASVRIDDPRIVQFDAARAAIARAIGENK